MSVIYPPARMLFGRSSSDAGSTALNVLMATTEAVPLAKTGGLADVCGALPAELANLGIKVSLIMPAFKQVRKAGVEIRETGVKLAIPIGSKIMHGQILETKLPGTDVTVYLVEQHDYFDREQLYQENGGDYRDNCERFVFFCRAVLEAIGELKLPVDVLHCNDWQTGLIPAYLNIEYRLVPGYENIVTLLTIHNLAYQGQFWHWDMLLTGLDWKYFNWRQMEFYNHLNLLKTGLAFSDAINTVSPRYAQEIQNHPLGCGLEGMLQYRKNNLSGILNGVDYSVWSPEIDPHLPRQYSVDNFQAGKAACKAALQRELGLPVVEKTPLIGFVGRLADQKGCDLIAAVMHKWVETEDAQWVLLGTGDPGLQEQLKRLQERFPQKVSVVLKFSEELAHKIEAASDMFLMPSRYEPCGLSQLYSLKYGSVPVVRATGGLADTIVDVTPMTMANGTANGFSFVDYSSHALEDAIGRACTMYRTQPETWKQLVTNGMNQDWSWARSARQYGQLYKQMISAGARRW